MDQALWRRDCNGRRVLGYGGDFGERQSDYAFSGNGIVFADGTEKPAMQEVRYWYASSKCESIVKRRKRMTNDAVRMRMTLWKKNSSNYTAPFANAMIADL